MNVDLLRPRLHSWRYDVLSRGLTTTTTPSEGFTMKIETARPREHASACDAVFSLCLNAFGFCSPFVNLSDVILLYCKDILSLQSFCFGISRKLAEILYSDLMDVVSPLTQEHWD